MSLITSVKWWLAARRGRMVLDRMAHHSPARFEVHTDTKDDILHYLVKNHRFVEEVELPEGRNGLLAGGHVWKSVKDLPRGMVRFSASL